MEDHFKSLAFFSQLTSDQIEILKPIFSPCKFPGGTTIFEQGEAAEFLYIVVSGEVVVNFKPDDGANIVVARVQAGGVVGWSAALHSRKYTSSAITEGDTVLLQVNGNDLRQICRQYPDIGKIIQDFLAAVIVERVRVTHAQVVALIELGLGTPNN